MAKKQIGFPFIIMMLHNLFSEITLGLSDLTSFIALSSFQILIMAFGKRVGMSG